MFDTNTKEHNMQNNRHSDPIAQLQGFEDFVRSVMQEWRVRGVALAVVKDNEVIYIQGFGQRDESRSLPVTQQTLFPIASCTKAFTTASMAILADQGKLDWDTHVREYIPSFKLYDPFATERATARDLVTHRTGLPRHDLMWYHNLTATRQELFERLRYLEPTKDFRTFWQYQNGMYMAAGYLVEVLSDQSWEGFVQQHIFQPLEMKNSIFDIVQTSREAEDVSHPYRELSDGIKEIPFYAAQSAMAPAGAIVSNVTEMSNWVLMHLNQGVYKEKRIISASQVKQMHTPQMVIPQMSQYPEMPYASYALGWRVLPYRGYPTVGHSGGIDGFRSLTTLFPREQIGIVVLSNLGTFNIPEMLTYYIFERLMGLDEVPWSERFMREYLSYKEAEKEGKAQSSAKRVVGDGPSHPLKSYTGDFEHPGYGMLSVALEDGQLQGTFNGITFPILHYHYDIFDFVWEILNVDMKASFLTNVKGDIDTLVVPFEVTGNDIVFKRVPDKLMREQAFLEQFVGVYEFLEMQFVVFLKDEHTLSLTIPGQPDYELTPYKGNEFLAKGRSGLSVEFEHNASGAVTGLAATMPDGMFRGLKNG
jgi:CubicO group peptidase (beta-lactamase class C family)